MYHFPTETYLLRENYVEGAFILDLVSYLYDKGT